VDLLAERRVGDLVRSLIRSRRTDTVHDVSDGGLAVALAEMAMAGGIGFAMQARDFPASLKGHAFLFGEEGARYVITVPSAELHRTRHEAHAAGVPTWYLGVTGGDLFTLGAEAPLSLAELRTAHEAWLPDYMAGPAAEVGLAA
jgi:phosphoribosylformylglycinamidine synthase